MSSMDKVAKELYSAMTKKEERAPKPYDTEAEVVREEGDTIWVKIPGGIDETPVRKTINAKAGDNIQVRVADGRAWVTGNSTNPPTDDTTANYAVNISNQAQKNVTVLNNIVAENIEATNARFGYVEADTAKIHNLEADEIHAGITYTNELIAEDVTTEKLTAASGYIEDLTADHITAQDIIADHAEIGDLDANYAHITKGVIDNAKIGYADVNDLSAHYAEIQNGHINSALINTAAIVDEQVFTVAGNKATIKEINADNINVRNLNAKNLKIETADGYIQLGDKKTPTKEFIDSLTNELNDRIDGAIETYTSTAVPTLSNYPANAWQTDEVRATHVGDVCYVVNDKIAQNGYCYRFTLNGTTFSWQLIKDSDVTAALQRLQTAEGKIGNIEAFDEDIATFKTETEGEISTLQTKTTNLETSLGDKVDKTTFNEVSQKVDENSASITTLETNVEKKADSSTVTTLSNTVNTVKQTATSNSSHISQLTTTLGTNADGSTKAGDIMHRASAVEQDLSGFKTTVSQTYQTKSDMKNYSTTTQMNSAIEQKAGEISLEVAQTEIGKIEVGGRNLVVRSTSEAGWIDSSGVLTSNVNYYTTDYIPVESGDQYTFSVWPDSNSWFYGVYFDSEKASPQRFASRAEGRTAEYYSDVFTIPENVAYVRVSAHVSTKMKYEKGNKATDWTPAPEDVEKEISETKASITLTNNSITSLVEGNTTYTKPDGSTGTSAIGTAIKQTQDNVLIKATRSGASAADKTAGGTSAIGLINVSPDNVKIAAKNVDITGTTTFSDGTSINSIAQAAADSIEVGGRNLVRYTDYSIYGDSTYSKKAGSTATFYDDRVTIGFGSEVYKTPYAGQKLNNYFIPQGTEVICSVYVYEQTIADGHHLIYVSPIDSNGAPTDWENLKTIATSFTGLLTWKYTTSFDTYGFVVDFDTRNSTSGQMTLGRVKVEKGNKATDWTPAPEDVQAEIDAKKSVHTLLPLGGEIARAPYKTVISWSADGHVDNWNVTSTSGVKVGDTARVGYYVSDMGSDGNHPLVYVVGTVNEIVSDTRVNMTSHGLDTTIIDGGNILTNSIGANQIAANAIDTSKLTVGTQNDVLNSKIQIGGTNLIPLSRNLKSFTVENASAGPATFTNVDCYVAVTASSASRYGIYYDVDVTANTEYTLSFKTSGVTGTVQFGVGNRSASTPDWAGVVAYTNIAYGLNTKTFTVPSGCTKIRIYICGTNGAHWYIWKIKLEVGNKATDWTPALRDTPNVHNVTASGSDASYSYANILTYSEATNSLWNIGDNSGLVVGDTVRIKVIASDMGTNGTPVYITGTVSETPSNNTHIRINAHGLDTTVIDGGHILTGTIDANKVNISNLTVGAFGTSEQSKVLNSEVQVGGKNLCKNTGFNDLSMWYGSPSVSNGRLTITTATEVGISNDYKTTVTIPAGAQYTVSCYFYENTIVDGNRRIYFRDQPAWDYWTVPANFTGLFSRTAVAAQDITRLAVEYDTRNMTSGKWVVGPVKIELGNKATDWTPAPEDIGEVKYVDSNYSVAYNTLLNWVKIATDTYLVTSTAGLKIGDVVYIRVTCSTTNSDMYVQGQVTEIVSATQIKIRLLGLIDKPGYGSTIATSYITEVNSAGITIHPSGGTNDRIELNGSGMRVYKGNSLRATFSDEVHLQTANGTYPKVGINATSAWLGTASDTYADMRTDGLNIVKGGTSVAFYGDEARVGKPDKSRVYITADNGMRVYDKNNKRRLWLDWDGFFIYDDSEANMSSFTPASIRLGKAADRHLTIDPTNGMRVFTGTESDSTNVAQFSDTVRIGKEASRHVAINSESIDINNGSTTSASFGEDVILGKDSSYKTIISSDELTMMDNNNDPSFSVTSVGNSRTETITTSPVAPNRTSATGKTMSTSLAKYSTTYTFRPISPIDGSIISGSITYSFTANSAKSDTRSLSTPYGTISIQFIPQYKYTNNVKKVIKVQARITTTGASGKCIGVQKSYQTTVYPANMHFSGDNNLLWSADEAMYMISSHIIYLNELVSSQLTGIVVAWSAYVDSEMQNYDWIYSYVPKMHVINNEGTGVAMPMSVGPCTYIGSKYVYVYDDRIVGHANNNAHGSKNGVTYDNRHWVIRYVYGV